MKKAPKKLRKAYSYPKWAVYVAQDSSGDLWAYDGKPEYIKSCGIWEAGRKIIFAFLGTASPPKKAKKQVFKL